MPHKFDPSEINKLDNEWRREHLPPYKTLLELGLLSDDIVADIGCGIGYFTLPIAEIIKPSNKVYALDTSEEMLIEVERRASFADAKNVITLNTSEYGLRLDDKMVSYSLLGNVLHEIEDKDRFINEIKRISKQNAKIAIIEWEKKETERGPALEDRLDRDYLKTLLEEHGFHIIKEVAFSNCFYGVIGILK